MRWARIVAIAVLVLGLGYAMFSIWDRDAFERWVSEVSPVLFFLAMAVLPVVGVPLSPFMLVAGATFGVWPGLLGSIAAIAINLCLAYAIVHTRLRSSIEALFARFGYKIPSYTEGGRAAWRFSAAVKLTPALPAFAKMYVLAVTSVPCPIYFIVSLGITAAFGAAWIVLGDSLLGHDLSHTTLAVIAIAVLAVVALAWWWKRRRVSDGEPEPAPAAG